jgi:hypothetical protein
MIGKLVMAAAWILAAGTALHAEASTPERAPSVRTTDVHLAQIMPAHCVAVAADGDTATIVLSRDELDSLAAIGRPADGNEAARQAWIAGMRAKALLAHLGARDGRGCQVVQGSLPPDTRFVVGRLLEQGHATVFTRHLDLPEPVLQIRYVDGAASGEEAFLLLDGTYIWGYGTWVS